MENFKAEGIKYIAEIRRIVQYSLTCGANLLLMMNSHGVIGGFQA